MIVYGDRDGMIAWALDRIGHGGFSREAQPIGLTREGRYIAVAVFDLFEPWGCEVSYAVGDRRWFDPDFAVAVFAYPFVQCGYERVTCRTAASNRPARILAHALGFKLEGRQRRLDPDQDRLVFGMLRSECRWLSPMARAAR